MKRISVSILLIAAFVCSSFIGNAQTADEIIDQYLSAIGGKENWRKINSVKMEGTLQMENLELPYNMYAIHDKGFRTDVEFQGMYFIDIVTPKKGWNQNPMADKTTFQPLTEDQLKKKLDDFDVQGPFIDYKKKGSTIEFMGKSEEDSKEYFKLKLTTKNLNETTYFFDIKTYLLYKQKTAAKQPGQEGILSTKTLDYRTIDGGVRVPFKLDFGESVLVVKKVKHNISINEKVFTPIVISNKDDKLKEMIDDFEIEGR